MPMRNGSAEDAVEDVEAEVESEVSDDAAVFFPLGIAVVELLK
jgi:hypothetical protein